MKKNRFLFAFILLLIGQVCIYNFFRLTQFVTLSILPAMIMMIPIKRDTVATLIISFISAFAVDFFADGVIGLNIAALLPVALLRFGIIRLVCGAEVSAREEDISIPRQGIWKISLILIMAQSLFLIVYLWLDGAGTRPFWFTAARFEASLLLGFLLSLLVVDILEPEKYSTNR